MDRPPARFRWRSRQKADNPAIRITPSAIPTPNPAFAPVDSPPELSEAVGAAELVVPVLVRAVVSAAASVVVDTEEVWVEVLAAEVDDAVDNKELAGRVVKILPATMLKV